MGQIPTLTVYSDFICPFCYIGKVNAERLRARIPDLHIRWRELELHPADQPDPDPAYLQRAQEAAADLAARYGIPMRAEVVTTLTSRSRNALLGLEHARDHGCADAYRDAVFRAYWQAARDIGDLTVLAELAADLGLDVQAFRRAVVTEAGGKRLQTTRAEALRLGLRGLPAFVAGDAMASGAQPVEVLERLVERSLDGVDRG